MKVAGRMKLEAAYYNAMFGMWEFLIEPVETRHHGRVAHQPWEVLFEVWNKYYYDGLQVILYTLLEESILLKI